MDSNLSPAQQGLTLLRLSLLRRQRFGGKRLAPISCFTSNTPPTHYGT